jgi:aspartyl-tRNA(Asn)/glutamyl-tRNA(Gln) amidotransferase subunit B
VRAGAPAAAAANIVLADLSRLANEAGIAPAESKVTPVALAELVALLDTQTINSKIGKDVLARVWREGGSPKAIVEREGLAQTSDPAAVGGFVDAVIAANAQSATDFRAGKENALKFLVGQVMKTSRGKANPVLVEQVLRERLTS